MRIDSFNRVRRDHENLGWIWLKLKFPSLLFPYNILAGENLEKFEERHPEEDSSKWRTNESVARHKRNFKIRPDVLSRLRPFVCFWSLELLKWRLFPLPLEINLRQILEISKTGRLILIPHVHFVGLFTKGSLNRLNQSWLTVHVWAYFPFNPANIFCVWKPRSWTHHLPLKSYAQLTVTMKKKIINRRETEAFSKSLWKLAILKKFLIKLNYSFKDWFFLESVIRFGKFSV